MANTSMTYAKISLAAIAAGFITMASPVSATDSGIEVVVNQAKIVKLARPADTIVVGNPEIADASVQNSSTIVLTGRGFGVTNLVILDEDGAPIIDEQIYVTRQDARSVRVYRGASLQTLSCTPTCEAAHRTAAEEASDASIAGSQ